MMMAFIPLLGPYISKLLAGLVLVGTWLAGSHRNYVMNDTGYCATKDAVLRALTSDPSMPITRY